MAGEIIPTAWVEAVARDHQQRVATSPLHEYLREHPESPINLLDAPEMTSEDRRAEREEVRDQPDQRAGIWTDHEREAIANMARAAGMQFEAAADVLQKLASAVRNLQPKIGVWTCAVRAMRRAQTNARLQRWRERALAGELP